MQKPDERISRIVERYVRGSPSVYECMRLGLVNYSALARAICKESRIKSEVAVSAACRRLGERLEKKRGFEHEAKKIIEEGRLLMRSNLIMAFLDHPRSYEKLSDLESLIRARKGTFNVIDGEESLAVITGREFMGDVKRSFPKHLFQIIDDLVQLSFIFPRKAITTPGVAARLYSILSGAGINVFGELTSCGDHLVVIHERDLGRALALIKPSTSEE